MSNQSIGRGPAHGSNENHDGDPRHKTLGEGASQDEAPAGNDLLDKAVPDVSKGPQSYPDGPNVEASPWELDAARGKVPKP
jgi:hypothetical protein